MTAIKADKSRVDAALFSLENNITTMSAILAALNSRLSVVTKGEPIGKESAANTTSPSSPNIADRIGRMDVRIANINEKLSGLIARLEI